MPAHDGLLPPTGPVAEDAILLHVGVHKTGTTALQAALADARPELLDLGVLYPGDRQAHHFAAQGVIGKQWGWRTKGGYQRGIEHFDQVAVEARAWGGRVMLSSEHFCEADDQVVGRIADGLGRDRLHVVVTLRNLGRLLPSSWQQYLKYGLRSTYDEWLVDVFDDTRTRKLSPTFWRRNEHGRIAQRWADAIGADRVTLVVLEHVDHSAMFRTFAQLLDIPDDVLTSRMDLTSNRSMTAQESELLRRVNVEIRPHLDWRQYETLVRYGVARTVVEGREPARDEPRLHTPDWALDEAARRGAAQVEQIRASGVRVVGDLPALAERVASTPPPPSGALDSVPIGVAVHAIAGLTLQAAEAMTPVEKPLGRQTREVAGRWKQAAVAKVQRAK